MERVNMRKKYLMLALLVVSMCCILCGCGSQTYYLTIRDDDTSSFSVRVTVDKDTYALLDSYGIDTDKLNRTKITNSGTSIDDVDALFQESAVLFQDYGFDIVAVNDSVEIGYEAQKEYASIDDLNKDIDLLSENDIIGLDFTVTKSTSQFKTEYLLSGEMKYVLDSDVDLDDENVSEAFNDVFDKSKLTASFTAVFPSSTSITNADGVASSNGAGVEWTTKYDKDDSTVEVHALSTHTNSSMYAVTIVVGAVILIALLTFVIRFSKKKKNSKNGEATN